MLCHVILTPTMCSAQARAAGLGLAGSAPSYTDYLLVGLPMPWPRDVGLVDPLAEVQARCEQLAPGRRVRVQAVVPAGRRQPEGAVVVRYSRAPGPFQGFRRQQWEASPHELPELCEQIMSASPEGLASGQRDVLVCGHGSRDRCCGRLGPRLLAELSTVPDDVNLWRSSHLGGHRYAPTGLSFPEGAYWGFLDLPSLQVILDRSAEPASVIDRYRGSAGFEHPGAQLVEAALLAEEGWPVLTYERSAIVTEGAVVTEGEGRSAAVRLDFMRPDGSGGTLLGTTELVRQVQLTECEGPGPGELVDEHRLVHLEREGPGPIS